MIFNSFPTFEGVVAWEHLIHLFSLLGQQNYIDQLTLATFKTFDLNHDGCLSIVQFCNFASQVSNIFELIYIFRIHLLINFLQISSIEPKPGRKSDFKTTCYRTILSRKRDLPFIKEYMKNHNGKYPNSNCFSNMKYLLTNKPNPNTFDYECDISDISFTDLTIIIIKKYKSNFIYQKEGFSMKYLSSFTTYNEIVEIDKYYINYRTQLPTKNGGSRAGSLSLSTTGSRCAKAKSILKASVTTTQSPLLRTTGSRNNSLVIVVRPHNNRSSLSMSVQVSNTNAHTSINKTNSAATAENNLKARISNFCLENAVSEENGHEEEGDGFINVL